MNIADKIKKLLRLSQSPLRHEAELALSRAFEIAAKYHIDIESLDLGEDINRIVRESCRVGYRLSFSKRLAMGIAQRYFNVTPVISYPNIVWIGTTADIAMAVHVFNYLSDLSDRLPETEFSEHQFTERQRKSLIVGFFYGISHSLNKTKETVCIAENNYSLILVRDEDRRKKILEQEFPHTTTSVAVMPKCRDHHWTMEGYFKGKEVKIHRPINEPKGGAHKLNRARE